MELKPAAPPLALIARNRYNDTSVTIRILYFISGVSMSFRRAGQLAATMLATLIGLSCGQVYRPVVIPCSAGQLPGCPIQQNPNPANFHEVFAINTNVASFPGTAMQIDVSGDSVIAATSNDPSGANVIGPNPTHATILPNNSRLFVAVAGSLNPGMADSVVAFSPAFESTTATGFGTVSTFGLPTGSLPVFVHTTQNNAVYVVNYGTNSVTTLDAVSDTVGNTVTVGSQPVALAEIADGTKLYVVSQGDNTVRSLSTVDLSTITTLTIGTAPVWAVARIDGQRIYVITQGDGNLYTIRTDTDSLVGLPQPVGGPGANYAIYDSNLNRLYVVNPNVASVFVFDASTDPPTPLGNAAGVSIPAPAITGVGPVIPVSVAALPDGSRFYVASYVTATGACPDPNTTAAKCIIPQATVFDAASLTVKSSVFPLLSPATTGTQAFAVAPVTSCAPVTPYVPGATRFRLSSAAATDSSRVYVAMCDAGSVAVINTVTSANSTGTTNATDNLVLDLNAPFSASAVGSNGEPPSQNPIFLFTGQ
jgi:YVTN family beta-propeller protein